MADIGIILNTVQENTNLPSKEKGDEEVIIKESYYENSISNSIISILLFIISASISWNCNSISYSEMNDFEKLGRAFFAGVFGFFYIILYVVFWSSDCNKAYINKKT